MNRPKIIKFDIDKLFGDSIFMMKYPEHIIAPLLEQQAKYTRAETIKELHNLYGDPYCEFLYHDISQYHGVGEACPVEIKIKKLLNQQPNE